MLLLASIQSFHEELLQLPSGDGWEERRAMMICCFIEVEAERGGERERRREKERKKDRWNGKNRTKRNKRKKTKGRG